MAQRFVINEPLLVANDIGINLFIGRLGTIGSIDSFDGANPTLTPLSKQCIRCWMDVAIGCGYRNLPLRRRPCGPYLFRTSQHPALNAIQHPNDGQRSPSGTSILVLDANNDPAFIDFYNLMTTPKSRHCDWAKRKHPCWI